MDHETRGLKACYMARKSQRQVASEKSSRKRQKCNELAGNWRRRDRPEPGGRRRRKKKKLGKKITALSVNGVESTRHQVNAQKKAEIYREKRRIRHSAPQRVVVLHMGEEIVRMHSKERPCLGSAANWGKGGNKSEGLPELKKKRSVLAIEPGRISLPERNPN